MGGAGPAPGFAAPPALPAEAGSLRGPPASTSAGAIFRPHHGYAPLHVGTRARSVGDMVTILLIEDTQTSKSVRGRTQRDGGFSILPPAAGPLSILDPAALNAGGEGSFSGRGDAVQEMTLDGTLTVTVTDIHPNGTAEVRGEKQMMLSQGNEWVQFAGRIRLTDIDAENRLASDRVADARIIYSGNGAVQRSARPGWLSRLFTAVSPF